MNLLNPGKISSASAVFLTAIFVIAACRIAHHSGLAIRSLLSIFRLHSFAMTSRTSNARAMIIGMIIIRRRPGHGHIA
jgi:hypothetical protein